MLNDTFWSDGRQTKSNTGQVYSRLNVGKNFNPKQEMHTRVTCIFFNIFFEKKNKP